MKRDSEGGHSPAEISAMLAETEDPAARVAKPWKIAVPVLLVAMLMAGGLYYRLQQGKRVTDKVRGQAARRSVAVLGFKNLGRPEAAWLSTALAEELTTELAAGERLRTIPGESVAQMKINLALPEEDSYAPATLARVRSQLAADYLVVGSYLELGNESGGQLRLDACVQDTISRETICKVAERGTETSLFDLVSKTGNELRRYLGAGELTLADAGAVRASAPSDPETARLYAEGLSRLRTFDPLAARDLLTRAVAADPNFALSHEALSRAWSGLGYDANAKEEAQKAFDLSGGLSRPEHMSVEGRYREVSGEWDKAIDLYRTLFDFLPDDLDYGIRLANAQIHAGKPQDALQTVASLRKLPRPTSDDPRIDGIVAAAFDYLGDHKQAQVAWARLATAAAANDGRVMLAYARSKECWDWRQLGDPKKAIEACETAKRISAEVGDYQTLSNALSNQAAVLADRNDLQNAQKAFEEALALARRTGDQSEAGMVLNNLAVLRWQHGDLAGARKQFEESLAIAREVHVKKNVALALENLGGVLADSGQPTDALRVERESLTVRREIGDQRGVAASLEDIGNFSYLLGNLNDAEKAFEESLRIANGLGAKYESGYVLSNLGDLSLTEGDLPAARANYSKALVLWNENGDKELATEAQVSLARLSIEEGRPADAESPAQKAREEFRNANEPEDEITAAAVLAEAFLEQGKTTEAENETDAALALVAKTQNRGVRLDFEVIAARVRAASGHTAEARKSLNSILAEGKDRGYLGCQFEARLALGKIEMKAGQIAIARVHLATLEKDARSKGFGLIARKAAAAATGLA
jgi:tetratricopeptide (TPR) repeat protein